MANHKTFFRDQTALLLVSGNAFLTFLLIIFVWLKISAGGMNSNYFISYRPSLGIGARQEGTVWDILSFVAFSVVVLVLGVVLSYKTYHIKRDLSITILALTLPLLIFLLVVAYLLLALH